MAIAEISEVIAPAAGGVGRVNGVHLGCIFEYANVTMKTHSKMCDANRLAGGDYHGASHMVASGVLTMGIVYLYIELGKVAVARARAQRKRQ